MATTSLGLPPGFEIEDSPASSGLPPGFELESSAPPRVERIPGMDRLGALPGAPKPQIDMQPESRMEAIGGWINDVNKAPDFGMPAPIAAAPKQPATPAGPKNPYWPPPGSEKTGTPGLPITAPGYLPPEITPPLSADEIRLKNLKSLETDPKTGLQTHEAPLGTVPFIDAPISGIAQMGTGIQQMAPAAQKALGHLSGGEGGPYGTPLDQPEPITKQEALEAAGGAANVLRGGVDAASPFLLAAGIGAPATVLKATALFTGLDYATKNTALALGAPPQVADLLGIVAGIAGGTKPVLDKIGEMNEVAEQAGKKLDHLGVPPAEREAFLSGQYQGQQFPVMVGGRPHIAQISYSGPKGKIGWDIIDAQTGDTRFSGTSKGAQEFLGMYGDAQQSPALHLTIRDPQGNVLDEGTYTPEQADFAKQLLRSKFPDHTIDAKWVMTTLEPAPPPVEPAAATAPPAPTPPTESEIVTPSTPNPPTAATPTTPEAPATYEIQVGQLAQGARRVVMIPKGSDWAPAQYPDNTKIARDKFGNRYLYRSDLITASAIKKAAKNNTLPELLGSAQAGMGAPDKSELPPDAPVVVARAADGTEVQSTATTPERLPETLAATQAVMPPGGTVQVQSAQQVTQERQPATPVETPTTPVVPTVAENAPVQPEAAPVSNDTAAPVVGEYARAQGTVDGLKVRRSVPNTSSIESSLSDYEELPGIREVPISAFENPNTFYAADDHARVKRLAEQIKQNGEISPLIVVLDSQGPYVLEGGHRLAALAALGKKSMPAMVVIDRSEVPEGTNPKFSFNAQPATPTKGGQPSAADQGQQPGLEVIPISSPAVSREAAGATLESPAPLEQAAPRIAAPTQDIETPAPLEAPSAPQAPAAPQASFKRGDQVQWQQSGQTLTGTVRSDWEPNYEGSVAVTQHGGVSAGGVPILRVVEVSPDKLSRVGQQAQELPAPAPLETPAQQEEGQNEPSVTTPSTQDQEPLETAPPASVPPVTPVRSTRRGSIGRNAKRVGGAGAGVSQGDELRPGAGVIEPGVDDTAGVGPRTPVRSRSAGQSNRTFDRDYRIPDGRIISGSGEHRAEENIRAIETLRLIQKEGRDATPDEQVILAGYLGWGHSEVAKLFEPYQREPKWIALNGRLRAVVSPEEYDSAARSTTNAHFTSDAIVDSHWAALKQIGAKFGMTYLEPAFGVGNYYGRMPADLLPGSRRIAIERDELSGQISKLLYPDSTVEISPFQDVDLPNNYFDVIVSNVPFGKIQVSDPAFRGKDYLTGSIHNYYFAKSLNLVRPGGVVAFITSRYTMDAFGPDALALRGWLADRADLLGMVRLPTGAFRQNAGTDVETDIVFLQKRADGVPQSGPAFTNTKDITIGYQQIPVNEYYAEHPEMVIGTPVLQRGRFTQNDYGVSFKGTPAELQAALTEALQKLPADVLKRESQVRAPAKTRVSEVENAEGAKIGAFFFDKKGELFQRDSKGSVTPVDIPAVAVKRIKSLLGIRDALNALTTAEREDQPDAKLNGLRKKLNEAYDETVRNYGPLSSRANIKAMAGDPDAPFLARLEREYDPAKKSAKKAPIFSSRAIHVAKPIDHADTAKEALVISLNEIGDIDWDRMSALTGRAPEDLQEELAGLIYADPHDKVWKTADEYLSGDVRQKLRDAKAASRIDPKYTANIAALEAVQPEDIPPNEIYVKLGVTWVPLDYYRQFAAHLLDWELKGVKISYAPMLGAWMVDSYAGQGAKKWATARMETKELLQHALNQSRPVVYDRDGDKVTINIAETAAAQQRVIELHDEFQDWAMGGRDPERTKALSSIYNELMNNIQDRQFDGSHLTIPGSNPLIKLKPQQKNVIWRQIQQPDVLIAHAVGAGKTFDIIAAAMELKRMGLIKRPMIIAPIDTLSGWQDQFSTLYPTARLLAFSDTDLDAKHRNAIMAQIATSDWDAVIMPQSSFKLLPVSEKLFQENYQKLVRELEQAIAEAEAAGMHERLVKRMETMKDNLLEGLKKRAAADKKDKLVTFEQLGIDQLYVDESHNYRKLGFSTQQGNIAGIDQGGNQQTFDLRMKMAHIRATGRGVVFATGTPITNTMGELFSLMRYMIEPQLEKDGLGSFDAWAAQFGRVVRQLEPLPESGGYRLYTRFSRFVNLPELITKFRTFADIVTSDMLDVPRPALWGGKRHTVEVPMTEQQQEILEQLQGRAQAIRANPRGTKDNMLAVFGDAKKMAIDPRLIDGDLPFDPNGRLAAVSAQVAQIYKDTNSIKGTQAIFLDSGIPGGHSKTGFITYDELIKLLVEKGIPRNEIATIYDAGNNKLKRKQLMQDVNDGKIRVVIGSSAKLGVGVNIQTRLYAAHHVDQPILPAHFEQREGRILRQGNTNPEVKIFVYLTPGGMDEVFFGHLLRKQKFISDALQGKTKARTAEDVGGLVASFENFQAMASGNPLVMRKVVVDGEVDQLDKLRSAYMSERIKIRREQAEAPLEIRHLTKDVGRLTAASDVIKTTGRVWAVNGQKFEGEGIRDKVADALKAIFAKVQDQQSIGSAFGVPLDVVFTGQRDTIENLTDGGVKFVKADGYTIHIGDLDRAVNYTTHVDSLSGLVQRIENLLNGFPEQLAFETKKITDLTTRIQQIDEQLAKPWRFQDKYAKLKDEQEKIDKELLGTHQDDTSVGEDEIIKDENAEGEETSGEETEGAESGAVTPQVGTSNPRVKHGIADKVRPLSDLPVPALDEKVGDLLVWAGNSVAAGDLISDGTLIVDTATVGDQAKLKPLLDDVATTTKNAQASVKRVYDGIADSATKPLEEIGYLTDSKIEKALYATPDGTVIALSAKKVRLLQDITGFDEVRGSTPLKPVALYRNDEMVAVLAPVEFDKDIDLAAARAAAARPGKGAPRGGSFVAAPASTGKEFFRGDWDVALTQKGHDDADKVADRIAGQATEINSSPMKRAKDTADAVALTNPQAGAVRVRRPLKPMAMGAHEGEEVTQNRIADLNSHILNRPDEPMAGVGKLSGNPGQSFNEWKNPLIEHLQSQIERYKPGDKILNVTHYRDIQAVRAWVSEGMPADGSIDTAEMTAKGDQKPAELFRLDPAAKTLTEARDMKQDGIYFLRHGETEANDTNTAIPRELQGPQAGSSGLPGGVLPSGLGAFGKPLQALAEKDVVPAAKGALETIKTGIYDFARMLAPQTRGDIARRAYGTVRHLGYGERLYRRDQAKAALEGFRKYFEELPAESGVKGLNVIDAIENGDLSGLDPTARAFAEAVTPAYEQRRDELMERGIIQHYLENYFTHLYKDPEAAERFVESWQTRRPIAGKESFRKQRKYPTLREALEDPKFPLVAQFENPVDYVLAGLAQMDKSITGHDVFTEWKPDLVWVPSLGGHAPQGYSLIDDKLFTRFGKPSVTINEAFDKQLVDRLNDLAASLGIKHERRIKIGGKRWGYAEKGGNRIVTKFGGPESILAHELGHQLDWKYNLSGLLKAREYPERTKELRALADLRFEDGTPPKSYVRYVRGRDEKMANAIAALLYAPEKFQRVAPNTWDFLRNELWHIKALRPIFGAERSMTIGTASAEAPVGGMVTMGHWYAPDQMAQVANNWIKPGLEGKGAYQAYMKAKGAWNAINLGFSYFHVLTSTFNSQFSDMALMVEAASSGEIGKALNPSTVLGAAVPFASIIRDTIKGGYLEKVWNGQIANPDPVAMAVVDALKMAGGSPNQTQFDPNLFWNGVKKAWAENNPIGAGARLLNPLLYAEQFIKPVMGKLVPRAKLGAFYRAMLSDMEHWPDMDRDEARQRFAAAWDSIDDRFGQLNQNNLLMNAIVKGWMNIISGRPGWTLGSLRGVIGGTLDVGKYVKEVRDYARTSGGAKPPEGGPEPGAGEPPKPKAPRPRVSHRTATLISWLVGGVALNGITTYLLTGTMPHGFDYIMPRDGGKTEDGHDSRIVLPIYLAKDIYSWATRPIATLKAKLAQPIMVLADLMENRDFQRHKIYGRGGIGLWNYAKSVFAPFSVQGTQRNLQGNKSLLETVLPSIGIMPASRRAGLSPAEQILSDYADEQRASTRKAPGKAAESRQAVYQAAESGNIGKAYTLGNKAIAERLMTRAQLNQAISRVKEGPFVAGMKAAPVDVQLEAYDKATPEEQKKMRAAVYKKVFSREARSGDWSEETKALAQKYFRWRAPAPSYRGAPAAVDFGMPQALN